MAITSNDVKLMASERLTDYEDGGGQMSPTEVVDGVVNNLFPDISRLDRVIGRVSLRKAFLFVQTLLHEMFYGAHAIIMRPPADAAVDVTMFSTASYTDERSAARNRVESYLAVSIESRWKLLGTHLTGQMALQLYSNVGTPAPEIGATVVLRQLSNSDPNTGVLEKEQYVRIARIMSRETQAFSQDTNGGVVWFNRDVIAVEIGTPLRYDFLSSDPSYTKQSPGRTKVNETTVADAARYYGVKKLAANVSAGAMTVKVPTLFSQLVPAAQAEVPAVDQRAAGSLVFVVPTGAAGAMTIDCGAFTGATMKSVFLPCALVPGTVKIGNATVPEATDDGLGTYSNGGIEATIHYAEGTIDITSTITGGTIRVNAQPGVAVARAASTNRLPITSANRSYNWVMSLDPLPAPGSIFVDFMAQGNWYRLQDDGAGNLAGADASHGSGSINYATGSMIVTCGALPDVGSALLWGWGTKEEFETVSTTYARTLEFDLGQTGIDASSLTLTVPTTGGDVTVTSNDAGELTGTGITGTINYATGRVKLVMTALPASGAQIVADYTHGSAQSTWSGTWATTLNLGVANLKPGSISVSYFVGHPGLSYYGQDPAAIVEHRTARDDGAGNIINPAGTVIGSVGYLAGTVSITASENKSVQMPPIWPLQISSPGVGG